MPIDSSIALQGFRPADPTETYGRALSLKSLLGQQEMQRMQLDQARQAQEQEQALNEAYRSNVGAGGQLDRNSLLSSLAQRGLGSRIPTLQKQFADADKAAVDVTNTRSQIGERDVKTEIEKASFVNDLVSRLASNPNITHDDVIRELVNAPPQFRDSAAAAARALPGDPAQLRTFLLTMGLKAQDRLKALTPELKYQDTGKQSVPVDMNPLTNPNPQALQMTTTPGQDQTAAVTMRGQNMVNARAQETHAAAVTKPFEVTDAATGLPTLVRQDRSGNITPVPGYGPKAGASKPLNDAQAKALLFGSRAQESDKILAGLGSGYSPAAINAKNAVGKVPLVGGALEAGANAMLSGENQSAEQAQRDFINAVLRRESGAVISPDEFDNAKKQYFPQPGDEAGTKQQKARNRQLAIRGLLAEVPEGQRGSITTAVQPAKSAPSGFKIISVK